jgi:hypothetical protein
VTPLKLKSYFKSNRQASIHEIMQSLAIDEALGKSLVAFWLARGCLQLVVSSACGGCTITCDTQLVYQWISNA